jgi:hypothetical protein
MKATLDAIDHSDYELDFVGGQSISTEVKRPLCWLIPAQTRSRLTVMREEATAHWSVYDLEARKPASRRHDSARAAIDEAIERRQLVQSGVRAP